MLLRPAGQAVGAALLVLVVTACTPAPPPPPPAKVRASVLAGQVLLDITGDPIAEVKGSGVSATLDGKGHALIKLPIAQFAPGPNQITLELTLMKEGVERSLGSLPVKFDIPGDLSELNLSSLPGRESLGFSVTCTGALCGSRTLEQRDDGTLAIQVGAPQGSTVTIANSTLVVGPDAQVLELDLSPLVPDASLETLARTPEPEDSFSVPVKVTRAGSPPFAGTLRLGTIALIRAAWRQLLTIERGPVILEGEPPAPSSPPSVALIHRQTPRFELGEGKVSGVDRIAIFDELVEKTSCGPYSEQYVLSPGSSIFVDVRKVDYAITVFDRRSGAEVGRGVVHASAPECPKGLSVKSNEKPALPSTHPVRFDLRKFFDGLRKK